MPPSRCHPGLSAQAATASDLTGLIGPSSLVTAQAVREESSRRYAPHRPDCGFRPVASLPGSWTTCLSMPTTYTAVDFIKAVGPRAVAAEPLHGLVSETLLMVMLEQTALDGSPA